MKVVRAAFRQRRKTLRNTLTGGNLGLSRDQVMAALAEANIADSRRAQTLDWTDFGRLTGIIRNIKNAS